MPVSDSLVIVEIDADVAIVTLNRPERLNAWSASMESEYFDALDRLAADERVRAIVVIGAGRGFCAGVDMEDLDGIAEDGAVMVSDRPKIYPMGIPKPIIAAVNGACAGIGLVQALVADVRFASHDARFRTAFSPLGLVAEHGSSWLLTKHIGLGRATDLLMSSRKFTAEEALAIGLVSRVVPGDQLLEAAVEYAHDLATNISPTAMAAIKRQVYTHASLELAEALRRADEDTELSLTQPDFHEGIRSFVEKRTPAFAGVAGAYRSI